MRGMKKRLVSRLRQEIRVGQGWTQFYFCVGNQGEDRFGCGGAGQSKTRTKSIVKQTQNCNFYFTYTTYRIPQKHVLGRTPLASYWINQALTECAVD